MTDYYVPLLLLIASVLALRRKENTYDLLLTGGAEGLKIVVSIIPALVMLLTAVTMLRSSGADRLLSDLLAPVFQFFGIPSETALLVLVRPLSGSAALAVGADLMTQHGPDSLIGRTAAVMSGASETSLYVAALYFSAAGVKDSRWAIAAALVVNVVQGAIRTLFGREKGGRKE